LYIAPDSVAEKTISLIPLIVTRQAIESIGVFISLPPHHTYDNTFRSHDTQGMVA